MMNPRDIAGNAEEEEKDLISNTMQPLLGSPEFYHEMVVSGGVVYLDLVERVVGVGVAVVGTAPCTRPLPFACDLMMITIIIMVTVTIISVMAMMMMTTTQ